jgi:hypothetical protein
VLTPENYQMAWLVYIGAGIAALVYLYFLIGSTMSRGARLALTLLLAGLVLTPAHPAEDIGTWAPAIFISGFELLISGPEAAARPARSLLAGEAMAMALIVIGWLVYRLLRWIRRSGS